MCINNCDVYVIISVEINFHEKRPLNYSDEHPKSPTVYGKKLKKEWSTGYTSVTYILFLLQPTNSRNSRSSGDYDNDNSVTPTTQPLVTIKGRTLAFD